ncbi:MAG: hypothetical protein IRY99_22985, partial [Isosphaeraceae bacterium]|nr:hypothetical protein [Isosphaeraceae bacterium]
MRTGEQLRSIVIVLAACVLIALVARPLLLGGIYCIDDLNGFHLPLRIFYADCLRQGRSFDWCPGLFCGFYLQGEGQVGMYHPLHLLLYRVLPLIPAFNLELLLNYPALLLGQFYLLHRWGVRRDASWFGALVFALSGFPIFHYIHINALSVIAHIPWLLVGIDEIARGQDPRRLAWARLAVALLTTSEILMGYPQYVWLSLLVEASYALLAWRGSGTGLGRLWSIAAAKGLGILGGGVQLLPTWDLLRLSVRESPSPSFLAIGSLHPANVLQWIAPYLYKTLVFAPSFQVDAALTPAAETIEDARVKEFGLYSGAMVPVLVAWYLSRSRGGGEGRSRRLGRGALVLGVMALLLAFGGYTPLFRLTSRLPVLRLFRVPARYLILVHLATSVLAALGFAELARGGGKARWRSLWPVAAVAAASVLAVVAIRLLARRWPETLLRPALGSGVDLAISAGLVIGAAALVIAVARGYRGALLGIALFAAVDQGLYAKKYLGVAWILNLEIYRTLRPMPAVPPDQRIATLNPWDNGHLIYGRG